MEFDLAQLRALLRDVPTPDRFNESVRLLEEAFDYTYSPRTSPPPWKRFRRGADVAFFGERTLRDLFGDHYRNLLADRRDFHDGDHDWSQLRAEFQRYAVVGRRATVRGDTQTECVIFHSGRVSFQSGGACPPVGKLRSIELMRVRAGLMNRRQAYLLANHLNRFRRNRHHSDPGLTWSVVRGPAPGSSSRVWFDAVAGKGQTLHRTAGSLPTWGLGTSACEALALHFVKPILNRAPEQVFVYGAPRYLLPQRFTIRAVLITRPYGFPENQEWLVERQNEDASARAISMVCEQGGLLNEDAFADCDRAEDFWGPYQYGSPIDDSVRLSPAAVYATAFSREEAIRVMRCLRTDGYRDIRACGVGTSGDLVRFTCGMSYFARYELYASHTFPAPDEPALEVKLSASAFLQDKHTPWEKLEEWEREFFTERESRLNPQQSQSQPE